MRGSKARGKGKKSQAFDVVEEAALRAELDTEIVCLERAAEIEQNLEDGSSDADSTWFVRHLSPKQVQYGVYFMQCLGDWKKAASKAGYSPATRREDIEEGGDAMRAFMKAVRAEVAAAMAMTPVQVQARLNRLALKAEKMGDIGNAIRANVKLGELLGLFEQKGVNVNVNGSGTTIVIGGARNTKDDDIYEDAEWQEIAAQNGIPALPGVEGS